MNTADWGKEQKNVTILNKELNQQEKTSYTKAPQPVKEMALWKHDRQECHEGEYDSHLFIISELEGSKWRTHLPYWTLKLIAKRSCRWKWLQETNSHGYEYTTTQCASSTLPLSFTTVPFQRENTQLWSFNLAHNNCFCVLYCMRKESTLEGQWSAISGIIVHVPNFFPNSA